MAYSYNEYIAGTNSDGSSYTIDTNTVCTAPSYLSGREATDIAVVVTSGGTSTTKVKDTHYTITGTAVKFLTGHLPSAGDKIRISRNSSQNLRLTDYVDSALLDADVMDQDANQLFYMAQEAIDASSDNDKGDNVKLTFGDGDDLEIYHDGSHSYIVEKGTGSLSIDSAHFAIRSGATDDADTTPTDHIRMQVLAGATGSTAFSAGNESSGSLSTGMTNARFILLPNSGSAPIHSLFGSLSIRDDHALDSSSGGNLTVNGQATIKKQFTVEDNNLTFGSGVADTEVTLASVNNRPFKLTQSVTIDRPLASTLLNVESSADSSEVNVTSSGGNATMKVLSTDSDGLANIEVKGTEGGYIDLGEPSTDDYDLRIEHGLETDNESLIRSKHPLIIQTDTSGGEVTIKREGSTKLATSANGIDVTGTLTASSDIEVTDNTKGVILKSPNGSRFRLEVANDGTLSTEAL